IVFIIPIPDVNIPRDLSPNNLSKMVPAVAVCSPSQKKVPIPVVRYIIQRKNRSIKAVVQPPSPDDVGTFNGCIANLYRGQFIIFPILFIIPLTQGIMYGCIGLPVGSPLAGIDKLIMVLIVVVSFVFVGIVIIGPVCL